MLAFLAAATVATAVPTGAPPPRTEATMPNLYRTPAGCREMPYHVVDKYGRPLPTRLGDLPRAGAQLLVDRRINGCPVITVMYGSVQRDRPNPPAEAYRIEPLR